MNDRHPVPSVLPVMPVLVALVVGCVEQPVKPVEHTVKKVPAETTAERTQSKAEFEAVLKDKLEKLEEEIRELNMKAARLKDAARAKWAEQAAELDAKQRAARAKLDDVAQSTGEAWGRLQDGARKAWEELEEAVRKARSAL